MRGRRKFRDKSMNGIETQRGGAAQSGELTFLEGLLDKFLGSLAFLRDITSMFTNFAAALYTLKRSRWQYTKSIIFHQIVFSGVDALYVVGLISAILGGVVMVQMVAYSPGFQADKLLMQILVTTVITELAPLITTLILVGRSGSAITVEMGSMKIKGDHLALTSMGIDITQYSHLPRVIGLAVSNVILNLYFVLIMLTSALLLSAFQKSVNVADMLSLFIDSLRLSDMMINVLKGALLGTTVALVCIYHGQKVENAATEIPQQTSRAIVNSMVLCFAISAVISLIWYLAL